MPRAILILALVAACGSRERAGAPAAPGPDGLRAHLAAARRDPARAVDGWLVPEAGWRSLVTDGYAGRWPAYAEAFAARRDALVAALARARDVAPRWQYADDPALSPAQVRLRWALPRPGVVHPDLPVVFVHDGAAWRALVTLDAWIAPRAEAAHAGCAAAYQAMAPKACQEWAWAIAEAALRDQAARLARACAQATAIGCGRH